MDIRFIPRPGAVRYKNDDGEWVHANPHDLLFSTVTMLATQYWKPDTGWTDIYEDGEGDVK